MRNAQFAIRILHIEDNRTMASLVAETLTENAAGMYCIHHVERHSEGLDYIREHPVDIVLLDLGLPDSRGPGGIDRIRKILPQTPVIVVSADDDVATRKDCHEHGAIAFLSKYELSGTTIEACLQAAVATAGRTTERQ